MAATYRIRFKQGDTELDVYTELVLQEPLRESDSSPLRLEIFPRRQ